MPRRLVVTAGLLLAAALCAGGGACRGAAEGDAPGVMVFAAASTTDVLTRIAARFEAQTGVRVKTNFAASSMLAKQIDQGARADVFVSANPEWMDWLEERGRLRAGTRRDVAGNELVLIVPRGRSLAVRFEPDFPIAAALGRRLALGDPAHVPAGGYAKAALERLGWWEALAPRVIPTMDVRAALALVELGEVDAAIVYRTDAAVTERVAIAGRFPAALVPPIRYPAALTADAEAPAARFLDYLAGEEAAAELRAAGFSLPDGAALPAAAGSGR